MRKLESMKNKLALLNKTRNQGKVSRPLSTSRKASLQNVAARSTKGLTDIVPTIESYLRGERACLVYRDGAELVVVPCNKPEIRYSLSEEPKAEQPIPYGLTEKAEQQAKPAEPLPPAPAPEPAAEKNTAAKKTQRKNSKKRRT